MGMKVTLHCVDEGDQQQVVKVVLPPLVHYTVEVVENALQWPKKYAGYEPTLVSFE